MASSKLKRDFPYAAGYIDHNHSNPILDRLSAVNNLGCLASGVGAPVVAMGVWMIGARFMGPPAGFVAFASFFAALIALYSYGTKVGTQSAKKATQEERLIDEAYGVIMELRKLDRERKLLKHMDPVAMQLIEASAYHWSRVHRAFDDGRWNASEIPEHWTALRERASQAADLAMAELIILCRQCIGEPLKNRKDDFQSVIDDFAGLEIVDALRGLAKVSATHPKEYRFSSPQTPLIFDQARGLAEQLKSLADEVEESTRIAKTDIPELRTSLGRESIDSLLSDLRHIKRAEVELHEEQRSD